MKTFRFLITLALLLFITSEMQAQVVSNNNEDEVNKVDTRFAQDFVPGQVLVKFKDNSSIQVRRVNGKYRSASISAVDQLLQSYGVDDMEKLFPEEKVAKPKSQLRKRKAYNGTIVEEKNLDKVYWIKTNVLRPDSTLQLIEQLKAMDDVEYAEPNYYAYITSEGMPLSTCYNSALSSSSKIGVAKAETEQSVICSSPEQNPLYSQQWGIKALNIDQLWDKPIINKKRPVIAILDTGVDINHPDLVDNIWTNPREAEGETAYDDDNNGIVDDVHGWNFVDNYYDLTDRNSHGTHVAGIAAAADNGVGIIGANPLALIMPVKVMNDRGQGDVATICRGIKYAADNGADVINMSFGGRGFSNVEKEALDYAYITSILVASAGNYGKDIYNEYNPAEPGTLYPAAYYLVLGIQATSSGGGLASFSNYDPDGPIFSEDGADGRNYEIKAPGAGILSTVPDGGYKNMSGTSMSSPLFAGAVSALQMVKEYSSRDVLFGDLIHLKADFAQIYSDESHRIPKLDVCSIDTDDSSGNNNGQIDVGETILFSTILRNTWADATNIKLNLAVEERYQDFVDVLNPEVDFGWSLSAYARTIGTTPFRVRFSDDIGDGTRIKFLLSASCNENPEPVIQKMYVSVNNKSYLSSLIFNDTTIVAGKTLRIDKQITFQNGTILTIDPGACIEFIDEGRISGCTFNAKGTPDKPIRIKTLDDKQHSIHSTTSFQITTYGVYSNSDSTIFTLDKSPITPYYFSLSREKIIYYNIGESDPQKVFRLDDYINIPDSYDDIRVLLRDPEYITSAVKNLLKDYDDYCEEHKEGELSTNARISGNSYSFRIENNSISYCIFEGNITFWGGYDYLNINDCIYDNINNNPSVRAVRTNIYNSWIGEAPVTFSHSNIINCYFNSPGWYGNQSTCNIFTISPYIFKNGNNDYIDHAKNPSYLGTSREDLVRPHLIETDYGYGFGTIDLSNMPSRPYAEAHGIVWKVVVNGKDAQDEFEDLAPLGVGRHKFEVYFNRPMNVAVAPKISFGVREPYTQHAVTEDGSWSADSLIYTAYFTITGKTASDGPNLIYVYGAEDNEYFEIPYEKTRFNINIQAAGSMATGFAGEAGLGKVTLTWNNDENDFDDAMGFNLYRYTMVNDSTASDTLMVNKEIIDLETTEYIDYDVTPGTTYYYLYKVLSTDLREYDVSNTVAVTPLTSTKGDANGSGDVDVADVITTVNYAAGQSPKPFIFEAADMNEDTAIDILDVIGIIKTILNPNAETKPMIEATATYTIEDGVVYVDSPVALAGVQVQVATAEDADISVADDLKGFEHTAAWLSDNDYLFLAYNMNGKTLAPGKHALLYIGDSKISQMRLSDADGHNVMAIGSEATGIDRMATDVMKVKGIYDLQGRKISGNGDMKNLPKGIYIVNGQKVVR